MKYVDYGMHARKLDKNKSPSNILCEVPDNLMCQEQFDIVLFADGVCLSEFYRPRTFGVQIHVARTAKSLSRQIPKVLFKCFHLIHLGIFWMTFCHVSSFSLSIHQKNVQILGWQTCNTVLLRNLHGTWRLALGRCSHSTGLGNMCFFQWGIFMQSSWILSMYVE